MEPKVNWLEWSKESFEKAKKEDKPILLDLTAVWCHWCHVMASVSYSNDEIAKMINQDFVPIKVYIDKRPDIRERYNMGGFPSTVFLNPEGHVIAGETYVPPERFKLMLEAVKSTYKRKKDEIKKIAEEDMGTKKEKEISESEINENVIKEVLLSVHDNFDSFYGGFGTYPKFPSPEVVDLLFMQYKKTKEEKYISMSLKTLDGMHNGIFDKVDFGFFRYSVTQDWKTPHYEKMLDANAGLLRNYAVAFNTTNDEKYRKIATDVMNYINNFLSRQNGGFYGSQDADEEYYHLSQQDRRDREKPHVDKTIYVDWNSMMISSYITAGAILNDSKAIESAVRAVDFILEKCYDNKNGLFHFYDGKAHISGLLSDNLYFSNCLIDAYFITHNKRYRDNLQDIAEFILRNFYDSKNHGFFDRIAKQDDFGALKRREKHFLENSFAAIVFLRLHFLTKEEKYRHAAKNTLLYFADSYSNFGYFGAMYATAVSMFLDGEIKVDVVERKEMVKVCVGAGNPRIIVNFIAKNDSSNPGYELEGAYVCRGTLCKGPIQQAENLKKELQI